MRGHMKLTATVFLLIFCCIFLFNISSSYAKDVAVDYENFSHVETSISMQKAIKMAGGINKFAHLKKPTPIENQQIIRMNRDTLYSLAAIDVSKGATITIPDTGKRYISMAVINNDGYTNMVKVSGGKYTLNKDNVGTDYALIIMRILLDANDPKDINSVNKIQDLYKIEAISNKTPPSISWNKVDYDKVYDALLALFKISKNANDMFGSKDMVDPVHFRVGTAGGFGGLPNKNAVYYNYNTPKILAKSYTMTLNDVPVNAFWSFTVYNKDGYLFKSNHGLPSINSTTAKANPDGSYTIYFGMCEKHKDNCLGIEDGWNGILRLYEPKEEVINHTWKAPTIEPK